MTWAVRADAEQGGEALAARAELVERLEAGRALQTPEVRAAFLRVPREAFVPEVAAAEGLAAVYGDVPLPTKRDARGAPVSSSSQPAVMAVMLEMLSARPGHQVLEIGTGTGYNAALLGELVKASGRVVTVELDGDVGAAAAKRLRSYGRRIRVVRGDGHRGFAARARYDRIIVTASTATIPSAWFDQLVDGGLLVVPLRVHGRMDAQLIACMTKRDGSLSSVSVTQGGFMGMRHDEADEAVADPAYGITVAWATPAGSGSRAVTGPATASMSDPARMRLAELLTRRPRMVGLSPLPPSMVMNPYLAACKPRQAVTVTRDGAMATGLISADGKSLAWVSGRHGGRTSLLLCAVGDQRCERTLQRIAEKCQRRGLNELLSVDARRADSSDLAVFYLTR